MDGRCRWLALNPAVRELSLPTDFRADSRRFAEIAALNNDVGHALMRSLKRPSVRISETSNKLYTVVCASFCLSEILQHKLRDVGLFRLHLTLPGAREQTLRSPDQDDDHDRVYDEGAELRHVIFACNIADAEQD